MKNIIKKCQEWANSSKMIKISKINEKYYKEMLGMGKFVNEDQ